MSFTFSSSSDSPSDSPRMTVFVPSDPAVTATVSALVTDESMPVVAVRAPLSEWRSHVCMETHGTSAALLRCAYRGASVEGSGRFATVSVCGTTAAAHLYASHEEAAVALAGLEAAGCGGARCVGRHMLFEIRLADPALVLDPTKGDD